MERTASATLCPCDTSTSTWRSFATISSGLCLYLGIVVLLGSKAIPQGGPLHRGRITFDLLGVFRGIGLAQDGASPTTGQFPNMIWLYRRPILDYWAEHEETLGS